MPHRVKISALLLLLSGAVPVCAFAQIGAQGGTVYTGQVYPNASPPGTNAAPQMRDGHGEARCRRLPPPRDRRGPPPNMQEGRPPPPPPGGGGYGAPPHPPRGCRPPPPPPGGGWDRR
ncbi:hypothetical protein C0V97_02365 [Asaia sp. W19]|nr:hypothetical protein C0V97_02365 [Asaia sp. W19]